MLTTAALEADGVQTLADAGLAMLGTTACSLRDHYCLCTLAWMEALSKWSTVLLCQVQVHIAASLSTPCPWPLQPSHRLPCQ